MLSTMPSYINILHCMLRCVIVLLESFDGNKRVYNNLQDVNVDSEDVEILNYALYPYYDMKYCRKYDYIFYTRMEECVLILKIMHSFLNSI